MKIRNKLIELIDEKGSDFEYYGAECIADHLIANNVIVLPCKPGDTVWRIRKFCEENTGMRECFRPSIEFAQNCPNYVEGYYESEEYCDACDDHLDSSYCSLDLKILCNTCKERFAMQPEFFDFAMTTRVFGTPMFNENTELEDTLFLTKEAAQKALEDYIYEEKL